MYTDLLANTNRENTINVNKKAQLKEYFPVKYKLQGKVKNRELNISYDFYS